MSTVEYVNSLKELRQQILRNLNDFTMNHKDYQNEVTRLVDVDRKLAFYGL